MMRRLLNAFLPEMEKFYCSNCGNNAKFRFVRNEKLERINYLWYEVAVICVFCYYCGHKLGELYGNPELLR